MSLIFIWRRSLRGMPGVSRMLQASAGQGCGPRGPRGRPPPGRSQACTRHRENGGPPGVPGSDPPV